MMLAMGDSPKTSGTGQPAGSAAAGSDVPLAFNQERHEGPTPSGGAYSIASYLDADGNPAAKADAARVLIAEFDANGEQIAETVGTLGHR
jgi:hypothetical protein